MKNRNLFTAILFALGYVLLLPRLQAVVPPPDGGYLNFNTAEGQNALFSLTTGVANTAVGWFSLKSVGIGSFNTGVGAGTLVLNTGDANTGTGAAALLLNTTGQRNTADGTAALVNNSIGEDNTAVGAFALNSNTASGNTGIGSNALLNNTTGGTLGNIQGVDVGPNVAVGQQALESNTVASANTAVGYQALHNFVSGPVGLEQFGACTAVGFQALGNATSGGFNEAFGYRALFNNTQGGNNVAIGHHALLSNTTGGENTAIGDFALSNNTIGFRNTALGIQAGSNVTTAQDVICIGHPGEDVSNSCFIGNIYGVTPGAGTTTVFIDNDGQLGTVSSSRRFKKDIKRMDDASEAIVALKPITFHYKADRTNTPQFGLIAEEVAEVNPDLVVRDKNGEIYTVRYDAVNAMLLNEFLKEHRKVQELERTIAQRENKFSEQEKQIAALRSGLQKVSAQLEMIKPAPQVAVRNPKDLGTTTDNPRKEEP
jgi:trimeric autotransporter adhesin